MVAIVSVVLVVTSGLVANRRVIYKKNTCALIFLSFGSGAYQGLVVKVATLSQNQ